MRAASANWSPEVGTVIDIGGQDSKAIWLDARGAVRDFAMNDRCAAGTGRFLEVLADRLGVRVEESGRAGGPQHEPDAHQQHLRGLCGNRDRRPAGSEHRHARHCRGGLEGHRLADGLDARAPGGIAPVVLTGGVARVTGMAERLSEAIGCPVQLSPDPEYTGALGAALLAAAGVAR
jgi:(R)-2-hydroxyacyl-CoA dehydratese activating ATPase